MKARENPFASHCIDHLGFRFPPGFNWDTLLARLKGQGYTGAIVGRHGSGKTTLLEELAGKLEGLGFKPQIFRLATETSMKEKERLPELLRRVVKPGFILLDGAEQLSTRHWLPVRAAASGAAGFVVTVHRTSRLPTLIECETHPPLLDQLVNELTGGSLPGDEAEVLLDRHHGNIRNAFHELYDRWAGVSEPGAEGDHESEAEVDVEAEAEAGVVANAETAGAESDEAEKA